MPKEMVRDAMDLAAILYLMQSITSEIYFKLKV
jgi:hypothetical protein